MLFRKIGVIGLANNKVIVGHWIHHERPQPFMRAVNEYLLLPDSEVHGVGPWPSA